MRNLTKKNIPYELGLKAIEYWLEKYPELIHSKFNKSLILVLKNKHFVFDEEFVYQIVGITIDTIAARKYVTLVMGYLEIQF